MKKTVGQKSGATVLLNISLFYKTAILCVYPADMGFYALYCILCIRYYGDTTYIVVTSVCTLFLCIYFLKGTVARDFWPLVFFMNRPLMGP
jgi:hypothetical protein